MATLDAARPVLEARGSPARKYSFYVHLAMGRVGQTILLGQSLLGLALTALRLARHRSGPRPGPPGHRSGPGPG